MTDFPSPYAMTQAEERVAISFTVPLIPPSVNGYVRHVQTKNKGIRHYRSTAANNFMLTLGLMAKGQKIRADAYRVEIAVFLGHGAKGDLDNFAKVVLDGLVATAVIDSDALVTELSMSKFRDWENPRTTITVRALKG